MKRIVIVGGTATLSKHLIPELQRRGHQVTTMGRHGCDVACDLSGGLSDIRVPENADVVVHVAAASFASSDAEILQMHQVNAEGTLKVCIAARQAGVAHFLLVSSLHAALPEHSPYFGMYSLSKRHAEELASFYCRANRLPLTILRPAPLYDDQSAYRRHQPLFFLMADAAEKNRDIEIYGRHDAVRNYLHVADLAAVIARTSEHPAEGLYTCACPQNVRLSEIAAAAQSGFRSSGKIVFRPDKADIADSPAPQDLPLFELIGFAPQITVQMGMERIANYRRHGG